MLFGILAGVGLARRGLDPGATQARGAAAQARPQPALPGRMARDPARARALRAPAARRPAAATQGAHPGLPRGEVLHRLRRPRRHRRDARHDRRPGVPAAAEPSGLLLPAASPDPRLSGPVRRLSPEDRRHRPAARREPGPHRRILGAWPGGPLVAGRARGGGDRERRPQRGDPRVRPPARPGKGLRQRRAGPRGFPALPALVAGARAGVRRAAGAAAEPGGGRPRPLRGHEPRGVLRGLLRGLLRAAAAAWRRSIRRCMAS